MEEGVDGNSGEHEDRVKSVIDDADLGMGGVF